MILKSNFTTKKICTAIKKKHIKKKDKKKAKKTNTYQISNINNNIK